MMPCNPSQDKIRQDSRPIHGSDSGTPWQLLLAVRVHIVLDAHYTCSMSPLVATQAMLNPIALSCDSAMATNRLPRRRCEAGKQPHHTRLWPLPASRLPGRRVIILGSDLLLSRPRRGVALGLSASRSTPLLEAMQASIGSLRPTGHVRLQSSFQGLTSSFQRLHVTTETRQQCVQVTGMSPDLQLIQGVHRLLLRLGRRKHGCWTISCAITR